MGRRMAQADSKREEVMAKPWEPTSLAGCPAQLLVFRGVSLTTQIHSGNLSRLWPPPARGIRGQGETVAFLYTPRDTVSQGDLLCIYCTLITAGREWGQGQWPPAERSSCSLFFLSGRLKPQCRDPFLDPHVSKKLPGLQ